MGCSASDIDEHPLISNAEDYKYAAEAYELTANPYPKNCVLYGVGDQHCLGLGGDIFDFRPTLTTLNVTNFSKIFTNNDCIFVLRFDNKITFMGDSTYGQFGGIQRTYIDKKTEQHWITSPETLSIRNYSEQKTADTIRFLSHGVFADHIFMVTESNKVYSFGPNIFGERGFRTKKDDKDVINAVLLNNIVIRDNFGRILPFKETVKDIACGHFHSLFLMTNGRVWSTGNNAVGQLGLGKGVSVNNLTMIETGEIKKKHIIKIGCCSETSFCLDDRHKLYVFGGNDRGLLGTGVADENYKIYQYKAIQVKYFKKNKIVIRDFDCGHSNICCQSLYDRSTLYVWGRNDWGQCGNGDESKEPVREPYILPVERNIGYVRCGECHTFLVSMDRQYLYAFGKNNHGQCMLDPKETGEIIFAPRLIAMQDILPQNTTTFIDVKPASTDVTLLVAH